MNPAGDLNLASPTKTNHERFLAPTPVLYKYHHLPPKFPSFLSMEFASLLRRSFATVTTARVPACREYPGSHEQYLLLLKSTVTRLVLRVPDRKDTLGHGMRACLGK